MHYKLLVLLTVLSFPMLSFADIDRPFDPDIFPEDPNLISPLLNCYNKVRDSYNLCMDSVEELYSACDNYRGRRRRENCYDDVWDLAVACEDKKNKDMRACEGVPTPAEPKIEPEEDSEDNIVPEPIPDPNANYSPYDYGKYGIIMFK